MADLGIKDFITETDEAGGVVEVIDEKKQKTRNKATYEVTVNSGIDIVIKRTLGRDVQYMAIIVSQGQFYIKKAKTNEIIRVDQQKYKTFWSGLDGATDSFNVTDSLGELDVYDKFKVAQPWYDRIALAVSGDTFREIAKIGLMTLTQWVELANHHVPTWMRDGDGYRDTSTRAFTKEDIRVVKYCVDKQVECGIRRADAIRNIYDRGNGYEENYLNKMTGDAVMGFMTLSWVYSWEVAFKAIDTYMENDLLMGFSYNNLTNLFTNNSDERNNYGYRRNNYGGAFKSRDDVNAQRGIMINFEANRLIEYLFNEALECGHGENLDNWVNLWADDLYNQNHVYRKIRDKYPAALPLHHDLMAYKYKNVKRRYDLEKWQKASNNAHQYETKGKKWSLIAPDQTKDIIDEATQMSNCVASYVNRMINGETIIMFLRLTDDLESSVCTVEVRNDEVVQFKAKRNAEPTLEQRRALYKLVLKNSKSENGKFREPDRANYIYHLLASDLAE